MIIDLFLLVIQGVLSILLLPLTVVNIAIDFIASIPVITEFLQVIAYVLPWNNLLPLIGIIVALFVFRIGVSLVRTVIDVIPFV